jgi:hypothetical protein
MNWNSTNRITTWHPQLCSSAYKKYKLASPRYIHSCVAVSIKQYKQTSPRDIHSCVALSIKQYKQTSPRYIHSCVALSIKQYKQTSPRDFHSCVALSIKQYKQTSPRDIHSCVAVYKTRLLHRPPTNSGSVLNLFFIPKHHFAQLAIVFAIKSTLSTYTLAKRLTYLFPILEIPS